jgi:hypothetical protein
MRSPCFILALLLFTFPMSAQEAFPPTAPGITELKSLPAGVLLKSAGRGNYFDGADNLFGPLFRYISKHNIAMTTPVEARIDDAAMFFWVAESERTKVAGNEAGVEVINIPERRVASHGERGGYSRANFEKARATLLAWLATRSASVAAEPETAATTGCPAPRFSAPAAAEPSAKRFVPRLNEAISERWMPCWIEASISTRLRPMA